MDVKQLNKYRITESGKRALITIAFLIIFLTVNVTFRLNVNADNIIKHFTFNDKTNSENIYLLNKQDSEKDYKEEKNELTSSENNIITNNTTSSYEHDNLVAEVKIQTTNDLVKTEKTQDLSYPVEQAYVKDGKKIPFLTFDDGPSSDNTIKNLAILRNYKIKATFIIIRSAAEKNKNILTAIANDGHAIGNHTYSHQYKTIYSNVHAFINEIKTPIAL